MRKIAILLIFVISIFLVSCSDGNKTNSNDESSLISNNENQEIQDTKEVDYSLYSALLKAYELDYNIQNISADDYEIIGMTLTPTYPNAPKDSMIDASGFCYANLVDLDNNGVLELVLIAYDEQEQGDAQNLLNEDKILISDIEYNEIIKVYTILDENNLEFLGSLPVSQITMPVSLNYGIEYIIEEDKTYIVHSNIYQMGNGEIDYYSITDGKFSLEKYFEIDIDGKVYMNGDEYTFEDSERVIHLIENLNDTYLNELEAVNKATFDFLQSYSITNFNSKSGAYNNGQFYFVEENYLNQEDLTIVNYYNALTLRDYDTLLDIGISEDYIENIKLWHTSNEHTYVPGHIVSNLKTISLDMIENTDLMMDVSNIINNLEYENIIIKYCRVNEVLDPHTTRLGLQIAGGTYDTYFILAQDDALKDDWKIIEMIDDKFYW